MNTLKEIYEYRQMIFSLVKRDLRGRYKGSVLGFLWTFINPLMQLVIYTIVFSVIMRSGIEKYYLYLFIGLVPWNFFSSSVVGGSRSVLSQQGMVTKIYFPREVLPISYVTSSFVNMLYCFIIVLAFVFFSGIRLEPAAFLYLPFVMVVEYFMALGMTMLSAAITVYFRDMEHILGILLQAWMFLTPIMYSTSDIPESIRPVFKLNPMSFIIDAYRDILYYSRLPNMRDLLIALILGVVISIIGFLVFGRLKRGFAEEM